MNQFDLRMNFRIIHTLQSADTIASLVAETGVKRVFMVTDPGIQALGLDKPLVEALERKRVAFSLFSNVDPNPTLDNVEQGLAQAGDFRPQLLVALGGGSAMDCTKAINLLINRGGYLPDYVASIPKGQALLPMVAFPTSAGTGSEVSPFLLISDPRTHAKIVVRSPEAVPKYAVLDPTLTRSLPPKATLFAGLDAMVHGFESYVAMGSQPYTQALALQAVELVIDNLPRVMAEPSNLAARGRMLVAANMAGMAFSLSYLGLAHSLANALAKVGGVPHGMAVGMMLSPVIRHNQRAAADQYCRLARHLLGQKCPEDGHAACEALADFVHTFGVNLGMPASLSAIGIKAEQVPLLVEEALRQPTIKTNPCIPSAEELSSLLQAAL